MKAAFAVSSGKSGRLNRTVTSTRNWPGRTVREARRQQPLANLAIAPKDCFYEDSFVKPNLMSILMSAQLGVASWAPDEDAADAS